MNFIKKQAAGSWLTFIALIVAAVSLIVYRVNIGSEGYFKNASVPYSVNYCIAGIVALAVVLIMGQICIGNCEMGRGYLLRNFTSRSTGSFYRFIDGFDFKPYRRFCIYLYVQ